jgi:GH25 family lysozyme M1 (1,4-beta-N-acetylmuramidase)
MSDSVNSQFAFGIDISRWNTSPDGKKKVNFDEIADHTPEVTFISMRSGVSWGYQDPWFSFYFKESLRIGRVRIPYHVLFPGESAKAQMDNLFRIIGNVDFAKTPIVLDLELDHGQTMTRITQCTADSIRIIEQRSGRLPIIYSRAGWIDAFLNVYDLPPVDYWLANYLWPRPYPLFTPEYPSPPVLPRGVNRWLVHQSTCRGKPIGTPGAKFMDYNRWNGDKAAVLSYANMKPETEPAICPLDRQPCAAGKTLAAIGS